MAKKALSFILAACLPLLVALPSAAQSTTGTITGRALDTSGGILPGVDVSISSPAMIGGPRSAVTDSLGTYRFGQLPPGTYEVKFQLTSFRALTIAAVVVNAGATITVNGPLQLDTLAESSIPTTPTPASATTPGTSTTASP